MNSINQKDYLKKYLKIGKLSGEKKKKKKPVKLSAKGLKIIDDDADTLLSKEIQDDMDAANEDAPQIVAIIDERPPSMRVDEKTKSNLWQPIGTSTNTFSEFQGFKMGSLKLNKSIEPSKAVFSTSKDKMNMSKRSQFVKETSDIYSNKRKNDKDCSPLRNIDRDYSPSRKTKRNCSPSEETNTDYSPPRKSNRDYSPPRKAERDISPPRKAEKDISPSRKRGKDISPPRRTDRDYSPTGKSQRDYSPPRKTDSNYSQSKTDKITSPHRQIDKDYCPPRKTSRDYSPSRKAERDISPPRKAVRDISPSRKRDMDISPLRKTDRDYSPPRNSQRDYSPVRNTDNNYSQRKTDKITSSQRKIDKDYSPPRKTSRDYSPPRKTNRDYSPLRSKGRDYSPFRKMDSRNTSHKRDDNSNSTVRKTTEPREKDNGSSSTGKKKSRWNKDDSPSRTEFSKPETTISGKKVGLQNAQNLAEDIARLQKQEEEFFRSMPANVSGVNAATVVRRKKQEEVIDPQKEAREKELKEKYSIWGKGIKQIQDESDKFADQQKEMNKPLARYADDEDLEKYLKEQEREGDPMLAYIRKKKKKVAIENNIPEKPMYMGDFMPNRFGIRPGYRWDGVDRSNGYEKKWFQVQNSKKAMQDEVLKWSTEDM